MADISFSDGGAKVSCPNCERVLRLDRLNDHLDMCLVNTADDGDPPDNKVDLTSAADENHAENTPRKRPRPSQDTSQRATGSGSNDVLGSMMAASRQTSQASHTPCRPSASTSNPASTSKINKARAPIDRHAFASVPDTAASDGPKGRAHPRSPMPGFGMGIGYTSSAAETGASKQLGSSSGQFSGPKAGPESSSDAAPLAERMRPQTLWDFVGQREAVNTLRALLRAPRGPPSLILWAPPGTGKTTLARIIAYHLRYPSTLDRPSGSSSPQLGAVKWRLTELSAITITLQEIKKTLDEAGARLGRSGVRTMIMVDEFQRINRGWQDAFLAAVERGTITLIAATTENPSFRMVPALLSRMRVVLLQRLEPANIIAILRRAQNLTFGCALPGSTHERTFKQEASPEATSTPSTITGTPPDTSADTSWTHEQGQQNQHESKAGDRVPQESHNLHSPRTGESAVPDGVLQYIASNADGDARTALNSLELAWALAGEVLRPSHSSTGRKDPVQETQETKQLVQALRTARVRSGLAYDRSGDWHYDAISALHKSIRGGDASAAVYWLARMVSAGDDPLYVARRMIIAASEDCGSNPMALQMAISTYQAVQVVGLPEAGETLAQTAVYLAESPKDTRAYRAWQRATKLVHNTPSYPVPMHIRNAPTKLMKDMGAAKQYRYEPRFLHPVLQSFLPPPLEQRERICSPPPVEDEMPHAPESEDESDRQEVELQLGPPPRNRPQDRPPSAMEGAMVHRWPTPSGSAPAGSHVRSLDRKARTRSSFLPSEAGIGVGACQRVLEVGSRSIDFALLAEWENERNSGRPWEGRPGLMRAIRRIGQPD